MKKTVFALLLLCATGAMAQDKTATDAFQQASIVTIAGTENGSIKENYKRGTIEFKNAAGQVKIINPGDVQSFTIGSQLYVSYKNDFYKVIVNGSNGKLYQKLSDNNGKIVYNGTEPVLLTTTDGRAGSYYLQTPSSENYVQVTAKNFEKVISTHCADCNLITAKLQAKEISFAQLSDAVALYNSCK